MFKAFKTIFTNIPKFFAWLIPSIFVGPLLTLLIIGYVTNQTLNISLTNLKNVIYLTLVVSICAFFWSSLKTVKYATLNSEKSNPYNEAYKRFTKLLSYTIGRYNGYSSNLAPGERKYTKVGVLEGMNEVKAATLELFPLSGKHVRSILKEAGDEWLNDVESFGKTAPSILKKIPEAASKDRT
jgi:hypothetical protein